MWTSLEEEALGSYWIDPCEPWGDHDLHWRIDPDGEVEWLTPIGEYTLRKLMLYWRDGWKEYWRNQYRVIRLRQDLENALIEEKVSDPVRQIKQWQIADMNAYLDPPVFHRVRQRRDT